MQCSPVPPLGGGTSHYRSMLMGILPRPLPATNQSHCLNLPKHHTLHHTLGNHNFTNPQGKTAAKLNKSMSVGKQLRSVDKQARGGLMSSLESLNAVPGVIPFVTALK